MRDFLHFFDSYSVKSRSVRGAAGAVRAMQRLRWLGV
jgi:hypothetical protein